MLQTVLVLAVFAVLVTALLGAVFALFGVLVKWAVVLAIGLAGGFAFKSWLVRRSLTASSLVATLEADAGALARKAEAKVESVVAPVLAKSSAASVAEALAAALAKTAPAITVTPADKAAP